MPGEQVTVTLQRMVPRGLGCYTSLVADLRNCPGRACIAHVLSSVFASDHYPIVACCEFLVKPVLGARLVQSRHVHRQDHKGAH